MLKNFLNKEYCSKWHHFHVVDHSWNEAWAGDPPRIRNGYHIIKKFLFYVIKEHCCCTCYTDKASAQKDCDKLNSGNYIEGRYFPLNKITLKS